MISDKKPSLVAVLSRFPFPLEKGDKLRAYHQLREMSKTFDIHLICISEKPVPEEHQKEILGFCREIHVFELPKWKSWLYAARMLFATKPLQVGYFYSKNIQKRVHSILKTVQPAHIFCQLVRASEYVKNYHNCPKTLDYMDAFSMGIERRISLQPFYLRWVFRLESKRLAQYERQIYDYFEVHTIISEQDARLLGTSPNQKITCIPNGVSSRFLTYSSPEMTRKELVFVGNLNYPPNVEAVKYILFQILPLAEKESKNWTFLAAGAEPSEEITNAFKKVKNAELLADVVDIREAYCAGKVFVAPMIIGTGLQNKLLEAMALGIPCVTTSLANNALEAREKEEICIANSPAEFVKEITYLLEPENASKMGLAGQNLIRNQFSWEKCTSKLILAMTKTQNL